ncbi:tyrosine-type recombinase/integrase [Streptomyces sp. NPDC056600]|uniref:tyrosine-type recombinase/integrase n=1 Tax=Streptomyces sp. NPDC056600 TaxID=3345874 RepID=UPI003694A93E
MSVEVMDEEWLLSEEQVRALLGWVREQVGVHRSVYPFMRMVAEHALRPSEARALRVSDVMFMERDLGRLAARHNGKGREIPLPSQVSVFLLEWISESGLRDADLLFPGTRGGPLSTSVCQRLWQQAQEAVLPRDELYSWRLGEPISILRDSCMVKWLRMGISAVTVAEWVGVTPSWLALRYPHCFRTEKVEFAWDHLAEVMALPDSLKP